MIQAAQTSGERKIKVQSDNYTVVYQLNNSKAADDLYQQLPLTIEVENYGEDEKIFYPPTPLDTKNAPKSNGKKELWHIMHRGMMLLCFMAPAVQHLVCMSWGWWFPVAVMCLN